MSGCSLRYARALFETARDSTPGRDVRYGALLSAMAASLTGEPRFTRLLCGPHVTKTRKKELLSSLLPDAEDRLFLNFLRLLVDKDRFSILPHIDLDYHRILLRERGEMTAFIDTPFPLDAETVREICEAFKAKTGAREIRSEVRLDPALIGGVRVTVGGKVFDGTARSMLDRLQDTIRNR